MDWHIWKGLTWIYVHKVEKEEQDSASWDDVILLTHTPSPLTFYRPIDFALEGSGKTRSAGGAQGPSLRERVDLCPEIRRRVFGKQAMDGEWFEVIIFSHIYIYLYKLFDPPVYLHWNFFSLPPFLSLAPVLLYIYFHRMFVSNSSWTSFPYSPFIYANRRCPFTALIVSFPTLHPHLP